VVVFGTEVGFESFVVSFVAVTILEEGYAEFFRPAERQSQREEHEPEEQEKAMGRRVVASRLF
jgi:hypothetical protein